MPTNETTELKGAVTPVFDALVLTTSQGEKLDLAPLLVEMAIYEDIFSPVMTGWITISDSLQLFEKLPLNGTEKLTSKVYTWNYLPEQNDDINFLHRTFDIVRITDVVSVNDFTKEYTLHFASPELKKNETFKLSKGYLNTSISKIISDIFTNDYNTDEPIGFGFPTEASVPSLNNNFISPFVYSDSIESRYAKIDDDDSVELFVEKTKYTEPVVSFPYMKPLDIIDWLSEQSVRHAAGRNGTRSSAESANFLLFENKRGFNFISVDTLFEGKEYSTSKFMYGAAAQNTKRGVRPERIIDFQVQDCKNVLKNIRNGVYASRLYNFNLENGNLEEIDYNYLDSFDKTESTERSSSGQDYSILSENNEYLSEQYLSKRLFNIESPNGNVSCITSERTERNNDTVFSGEPEFLQKRLSQLARLSDYRAQMTIVANTKHKVGDMIEIDLKIPVYKNNSTEFTEESSKYYSGYYLVTSIKHTITKREYKMNLEVIKDSYKEQIK